MATATLVIPCSSSRKRTAWWVVLLLGFVVAWMLYGQATGGAIDETAQGHVVDKKTNNNNNNHVTASSSLRQHPPLHESEDDNVDNETKYDRAQHDDSNNYNSTENNNNNKFWHFCTSPQLGAPNQTQGLVRIDHACQGPGYDALTAQIHTYLAQQQHQQQPQSNGTWWGRRPRGIPPNTTVLVVGNPHTRQLAHAWACQYAHHIVAVTKLDAAKGILGQTI